MCVTFKEVIPLNKKLGQGTFGRSFTVKYGGFICASKQIDPILTDEDCRLEPR